MNKEINSESYKTDEEYQAKHNADNDVKKEIASAMGIGSAVDRAKDAMGRGKEINVDDALIDNIQKHNEFAKEKIELQRQEEAALKGKIDSLQSSKDAAVTEGERNLLDLEIERKKDTLIKMQQEQYKEQVRDAEETAEALYRSYKQLQGKNAGSINKDDILHDVLKDREITETWKAQKSGAPSVSIDGSSSSNSTESDKAGFAFTESWTKEMDRWETQYNSLDGLNENLLSGKDYAYQQDDLAAAYQAQQEHSNDSFTDLAKTIFGEGNEQQASNSSRKIGALRQINALQEQLKRKAHRKTQDESKKVILETEIAEIEAQIQAIKDANGL